MVIAFNSHSRVSFYYHTVASFRNRAGYGHLVGFSITLSLWLLSSQSGKQLRGGNKVLAPCWHSCSKWFTTIVWMQFSIR